MEQFIRALNESADRCEFPDRATLNVTVLYTVYVYHTECDGSTQGHQDMSN